MSDLAYDYEQREIARVLDTSAENFALKIETRDDEMSHLETRWLTVDRAAVEAILSHFASIA